MNKQLIQGGGNGHEKLLKEIAVNLLSLGYNVKLDFDEMNMYHFLYFWEDE